MGVGELRRAQRVVRAVRGEHGQAGVRLAGNGDPGVRGQVAQVLAHLAGAGGAIQPDHVDAERLKRGQRRGDLAAEQHGPGGLDRDLRDDQRVRGHAPDGPLGADDGRLGLQQVLAGLDDQRVGAAAQQGLGVDLVGVAQLAERGVAEGGQLGARADRAEHPARAGRRGPAVCGGSGEPGGRLGQLGDPLRDPVLAEVAQVGAERVGGDAIRARFEVSVVDPGHDVGPGYVQDLVAALVAAEIVNGGIARLEHRAHGPVGHHDSLGEGGPKRAHCRPSVGVRRSLHCRHWPQLLQDRARLADRSPNEQGRPRRLVRGRPALCEDRLGISGWGGGESSSSTTSANSHPRSPSPGSRAGTTQARRPAGWLTTWALPGRRLRSAPSTPRTSTISRSTGRWSRSRAGTPSG